MQRLDAITICQNSCDNCPVAGLPAEVKAAVGILVNVRGEEMAVSYSIDAGSLQYAMETTGTLSSNFNAMTNVGSAAIKIATQKCPNYMI